MALDYNLIHSICVCSSYSRMIHRIITNVQDQFMKWFGAVELARGAVRVCVPPGPTFE